MLALAIGLHDEHNAIQQLIADIHYAMGSTVGSSAILRGIGPVLCNTRTVYNIAPWAPVDHSYLYLHH